MRSVVKLAFILAATFALYWVADEGFGLFLNLRHGTKPPDFLDSPAYRNEPEASDALARELAKPRQRWQSQPGGGLLQGIEYHSDLFNMDALPPTGNVYRRTINPEGKDAPLVTVLLAGSSVVYGPMVSDAGTLASALSARLNALDSHHRYVVYNAGVPGAEAGRIRDRIADELKRGLKPDIIISYDGNIDAVGGIYFADPEGAHLVETPEGWLHRNLPTHIYQYLRDEQATARERDDRPVMPAYIHDPASLDRLVKQTVGIYIDRHVAMAALAAGVGARYIAILEPNAYAAPFTHPTKDVISNMERSRLRKPGLPESLRAAAPALSQAVIELQAKGIDAVDLSGALHDKTEDIYYDMGHFNSIGYKLVADRIAEAVLAHQPAATP
jgi:lysophospholipase L1-like esterase